ncbi:Pheromone-regulated membrane protein 10 [Fulvia fulva]|uniref:Pheromone-regulated membrane protein 10 n=1 Tax=Passalora fulva TaxID=5499 RepID=A0A9Q8L6J0_PASFU|nr:Pheromone-regulated membrane protein 10 [Fulvia fulva]KAK4634629.1 Pheromone-regulated membrane protein 10 [Fulvia fulva]KAK4636400.1 Pheromone-regulated membrane protein 10 [Fulvia fulva]UJO11734.1 Pheromone-regulated membrane protein 10 [Fulvia fulva]WPV08412.1 Pheromone-regulated membrane protein 10 [Fulvia fulva]WPV23976.1 Pheromone-regulated membrane protein 10 [Fulvia fulva]
MSTPVEELGNPLGDSAMAESPKHTLASSGVVTCAEGGTPAASGDKPKGKKRVGFTGGEEVDPSGKRSSFVEYQGDGPYSPFDLSPNYGSPAGSGNNTPSGHRRQSSGDQLLPSENDKSHLPRLSEQKTEQLYEAISRNLDIPRPRPAIRRGNSIRPEEPAIELESPENDERHRQRQQSARKAFERGKDVERAAQSYSNPASRRSSPDGRIPSITAGDIPLQDLNGRESEDEPTDLPPHQRLRKASTAEAFNLVRRHTVARDAFKQLPSEPPSGQRSGAATPTDDQQFMEDYKPRPDQYRGGILGSLLKLYGDPNSSTTRKGSSRRSSGDLSAMSSPAHSPPESGATTPTYNRRWYSHKKDGNQSTSSLATLVGTSSSFGSPAVSNRDLGEEVSKRLREQQQKRPGIGKRTSSGGVLNRLSRPRLQEEYRITAHIAGTIARQKYLKRLCRALMQYGAPTHRLEEYMTMSARVLEIEAQFLYIPGAMIMSFEDRETHTSEVKLVKVAQGLDLGKLRDVHEVYKEVVHDKLGVEQAHGRLKEVSNREPKHNRFVRIPVYGLAAVCVGPFAFGARLIDLPIAFFLGCILGFLQLYVAPASDLYANVFEISAAVITSFLARAFGSIRGGDLFCFSALAQSSIALILPGYTVLCASLELQSRSIVAGSVRMVYAIIYSLFLGFGITIGTAIYGIMDKNATSETTCRNQVPEYWFFFFVPGFTMCLIIINQAKWKQAPVMMIIAFAGYVVNYFSARRFSGNTQVSNTLGALAIGVLANLYSRIGGRLENRGWDLWEERLRPRWKSFRKRIFGHQSKRKSPKIMEEGKVMGDNESIHSNFQPNARRVGYGLAAAAMLPAIFVQVPSGLAVNGSLVAGIASANQITSGGTNGTTVVNTTSIATAAQGLNSIAFTVGYSVVQVAIGITVGLFLSAIVVYPFGKRRSGLFSF